jgi:hypothetical protein
MTTTSFPVRPLYVGYQWRITLAFQSDTPLFPDGTELRATVRAYEGGPVLTTLTTASGGVTRVDDDRVTIVIDGPLSTGWKAGSVVFDLIRTDTTPDEHLGIKVKVPVALPITEPTDA